MRTNRKTDEKKMSMNKNIARLAVTAGLTAALSFGGVMAPVTIAFAAEGDNSITISQVTGNESTKFKAYQIFKADVVDPTEAGATDKIISNVKWAFDDQEIQKAIIDAINGCHLNSLNSNASAQDVADWLTANAKNTTKETRVDKDSVLNKIAKVVKDKVTPTGNPFNAGAAFEPKNADNTPNTGYYLFLTDDAGIGQSTENKKNTGTSPIFAVVGGSPVTVTEKTSIPTINKEILNVKESKDGYTAQEGWSNVADSQVGQETSYKLTGTIADNYATYDSYAYKFTDTLSDGLTYVGNSLEVYALNNGSYTKISPNSYTLVEPTESNNVLTVNFDKDRGLKSASADNAGDTLNIDAETRIVVFYKAKLNSKASYEVAGNAGNDNKVYLEYSNNPMAGGTGKSETKVVTDYVFGLDVTKVDEGTGDPLKGDKKLQAGFKVRVVEGDEDTLKDKWLGANGEIVGSNNAHEFKTEVGTGRIFIPGLDAGTYEITETTTPSGYDAIAPFRITVTPAYNAGGELSGLTVSDTSNMVNSEQTNESVTTTEIPVIIKNKKSFGLPLTGLNGVTFTWIAGGAVLCVGVAHLIRSRKQAEESEQE